MSGSLVSEGSPGYGGGGSENAHSDIFCGLLLDPSNAGNGFPVGYGAVPGYGGGRLDRVEPPGIFCWFLALSPVKPMGAGGMVSIDPSLMGIGPLGRQSAMG